MLNPESFIVIFFTLKVSEVIFFGEGLARFPGRKMIKLLELHNLFPPLKTTFSLKRVVD